jgi:transcriptional regulator with XRE-family HTH domain
VEAEHGLKAVRLKQNLSQAELAEKIGTTSVNVSRWERGFTSPSPYYRRQLCELFQIPVEALFPALRKERGAEHEAPNQVLSEDVFFYNHAVLPGPDEFFGRRRERRQLLNRIKQGQPVAIVGPRRIGKTWLLRYLEMVVQRELKERSLIGYLDAQWPSCATIPQLLSMMLHKLDIDQPAEETERGYFQQMETGIKQLQSQGLVPVICIDKFERVCKIPERCFETLEKLRALTQLGLCLVTASRYPIGRVIRETGSATDTSPFDNVFMVFHLAPFSLQEAQEFIQIKGAEAELTEAEQEKVLHYARHKESEQWFPWKLQLAGTLLHNDKMLASEGYRDIYRPHDPDYWQEFEQRIQEMSQEEN